MKFKDLKNLDYHEELPLEYVLSDMMFKGQLSFIEVSNCYTQALDRERHLSKMRFIEAVTNITQLLGDGFRGKYKKEIIKRAIHTFNLNNTLPRHIHDEKYGYTEEDKKKWDEFCETMYGKDFNEK